jgi:hypothetical protein
MDAGGLLTGQRERECGLNWNEVQRHPEADGARRPHQVFSSVEATSFTAQYRPRSDVSGGSSLL